MEYQLQIEEDNYTPILLPEKCKNDVLIEIKNPELFDLTTIEHGMDLLIQSPILTIDDYLREDISGLTYELVNVQNMRTLFISFLRTLRGHNKWIRIFCESTEFSQNCLSDFEKLFPDTLVPSETTRLVKNDPKMT
jgi:hypothetical protein